MIKRIFIIFLFIGILFCQTKRDPRSVGLSGAYTTIADGIFSVGYNPGLIGLQQNRPFMMQIGQIDYGILGNFFSIQNVAQYSGDTLDIVEKNEIFKQLRDGDGMAFFTDLHFPTPILNFSKGNLAFTMNNIFLSNTRLPIGLLEFLFYGNAQKPNLDMELNRETVGLTEIGVTFGMPFEPFSLGFTFKYLQGLFYLGIDESSSEANLETTDVGIIGEGSYVIRQGLGGRGFAIDVGLVTRERNGWTVGASLINASGSIEWNKSTTVPGNGFGFYPFKWGDDQLNPGESILVKYTIDTLRMDRLGQDSLFKNNTRFFPDTSEFTTPYPSLFRFGVSKRMETILFASDLVAGFQNAYYARASWKWSMGIEWTRIANIPMRIGYSWAGGELSELGLGFGYHKGPIIFDLGFAFRNGMWLHTMKGFNFSTGLTITSFKSRKASPSPNSNDQTKEKGFLDKIFDIFNFAN